MHALYLYVSSTLDYAKRLSIGSASVYEVIGKLLTQLFTPTNSNNKENSESDANLPIQNNDDNSNNNMNEDASPTFYFCPLMNVSQCPISIQTLKTNGQSLAVVVSNPLAWIRKEFIRMVVPVNTIQGNYSAKSCRVVIYADSELATSIF